jgi:hypothetical protein
MANVYFLLKKEIVCEFSAVLGKYQICRNLSFGFFPAPYT